MTVGIRKDANNGELPCFSSTQKPTLKKHSSQPGRWRAFEKTKMKNTYLIALICLFASCDFQKSNKTNDSKSSKESTENDSIKEIIEQVNTKENNPDVFELPVIGTFELASMKIDSTKEYGAGDCWGKVTRYSLPNVGLAIDSMNCGEYGYTYTYYQLSPKDFIQVVFIKKSESILSPENSSYYYIMQEQLIDFNSESVISMTKIDTVYDYNLREKRISKAFKRDTLKDQQKTYKDLELEYQGVWEMELDY